MSDKIQVINIPEPASRQGRDSVPSELLQPQHSLLSLLNSPPYCLFLGPWTFSLTQRPSGKHLGSPPKYRTVSRSLPSRPAGVLNRRPLQFQTVSC